MDIQRKDIPDRYLLCLAADGQCPRTATCLRAQAARVVVEDEATEYMNIVSPKYVETHGAADDCRFYRSATPVAYKRGMTHIYDQVPGKVITTVKRAVRLCFSCRNYYFDSKAGRRLVTPSEQQAIARVFARNCPDATPLYDSEETIYAW